LCCLYPRNGKDIKLRFPGVEQFPKNFINQAKLGIFNKDYSVSDQDRIQD